MFHFTTVMDIIMPCSKRISADMSTAPDCPNAMPVQFSKSEIQNFLSVSEKVFCFVLWFCSVFNFVELTFSRVVTSSRLLRSRVLRLMIRCFVRLLWTRTLSILSYQSEDLPIKQNFFIENYTFQAPVKTNQEIYENSMLEDDPNANTQLRKKNIKAARWGPNHKGAQTLANFYSTGESGRWIIVGWHGSETDDSPALISNMRIQRAPLSAATAILSFVIEDNWRTRLMLLFAPFIRVSNGDQ